MNKYIIIVYYIYVNIYFNIIIIIIIAFFLYVNLIFLKKLHTGHILEWSAINTPTSSFFLERDIQSNIESRACCPTAPSRCTYGISNVKIINLKKLKKKFSYYTI